MGPALLIAALCTGSTPVLGGYEDEDETDERDATGDNDDEAYAEDRWQDFRRRALTLRVVPAADTASGQPEYVVERAGKPISDEELEDLELAYVDPVVPRVTTPAWLPHARATALSSFVFLPAVLIAGTVAVFVVVWIGLFASGLGQTNVRALPEAALGALCGGACYGVCCGIGPGVVLGVPTGLLGAGMVNAALYLATLRRAPRHAYETAVARANRALAEDMGIDVHDLPERFLPGE
ncbi:MAG: hypothetical protein HY904_18460 [Deltaproteobacteria bacterium]|nr:hypothetical protein [Deltaproteobacteria bacterium]